MVESTWTCFSVRVPKPLDYETVNLHRRESAPSYRMITIHARPRQTDGQTERQTDRRTDEHHGNIATSDSTNASCAKKSVITFSIIKNAKNIMSQLRFCLPTTHLNAFTAGFRPAEFRPRCRISGAVLHVCANGNGRKKR